MDKCNMISATHCGREIEPYEGGVRMAAVHIHVADGRHRWETRHQCPDCAAKERAIEMACGPEQRSWRDRRLAKDISQREMARAVSLEPAAYSRFELCREVAPAWVVANVEQALEGLHGEWAPVEESNA